jgi:hypothetical protein
VPYVMLSINPSTPPHALGVVRRLEDRFFRDVHCMLRLPIPNYRLVAGCNFAITQVLTAAVGGLSTTLYSHSGPKGQRFKGLLTDYYPWNREPPNSLSASQRAEIIYSIIRNPLTHDLGLDLEKKSNTQKVKLKRLTTKNKIRGLPEKTIESLETTDRRFTMSGTVVVRADATVVLVEALYWGIRCLVESLTHDAARMANAETFLAKL